MAKLPDDSLANPAGWLANAVAGLQAELDREYATAVAVYEDAVKNWISENQINRDSGHPLTGFTRTKPVRMLAYAAAGDSAANAIGQVKTYAGDVDSSLPEAVLPPPLRTSPTLGKDGFLPALVAEGSGGGAVSVSNSDIWAVLNKIVAALQAVGIMPKGGGVS